jgi:hypothetical protein
LTKRRKRVPVKKVTHNEIDVTELRSLSRYPKINHQQRNIPPRERGGGGWIGARVMYA